MRFILFFFLIGFATTATAQQYSGEIHGTLTLGDEEQPLMYAEIRIEGSDRGAYTDMDGKFRLDGLEAGEYTLRIKQMEIGEHTIEGIVVRVDRITIVEHNFDEIEIEIRTLKPVIYLYPETKTDIHVSLDYEGTLTTTYPKYPEEGWQVTADTNGTLIDSTGRSYYSLYWEGIPENPLSIEAGTVVKSSETIAFLEESLATLGLNEREANEFIIYWLPELEQSPYNLISFSTDAYEEQAQLNIDPKPETIIRVMMVFQPVISPSTTKVAPQDLESLRKERNGFTVVEWGGQQGAVEAF